MSEHRVRAERVVVIGSGPAGAAAAAFLARARLNPLVLEAGAQQSLGLFVRVRGVTLGKVRPQLRQRAGITRLGDARTELYEALAPGGLSNHWSCAVPRFSDEDFADAKRGGEAQTWPIGYADLEPWYDALEPVLNVAGDSAASVHVPRARTRHARSLASDWEPVMRAADRVGRSVLVMPYANGAATLVTKSATAFNAYSHLVRPALRSGKLDVLYGSEVLKLEWSARARRVVAVIYRDIRSGRVERIPCRAVVLAAGAINSAQIMLQSTSADFPHGLGNEHDVLGKYLNDHPLAKLVIDLDRAVSCFPASYITRATLDRSDALYAAAMMQWSDSSMLLRSVLTRRPTRMASLGFSVFGTMKSTRENFVALAADSRRASAQRAQLDVSLRHEAAALHTLERAREDVLNILQQAGWEPRVRVWKIEAPGNSVHYSGSCRMHSSARFGVVDHHCRVHGVANVAIADSSVFTTGPEKNPVLTAMALAARASDQLAKELLCGDV
jgi:choline dehydrogenase-like flavoprotein